MKELKFSLEENAVDSLLHGIEHFIDSTDVRYLKYAVLHIAQAVELFLKERLNREHYLLVYLKPENSKPNDKTVNIDEAIKRLISAKVRISEDCIKAFQNIQNFRNQIQHFKISVNRETVKIELGRTLKYLEKFLLLELNIKIEERINKENYKIYSEAVYSYEERREVALQKMHELINCNKNNINCNGEYCPNCGSLTILFPDLRFGSSNIVECYLCKEKFESRVCNKCGDLVFEKEGIYHDCEDNLWLNNY